VITLEAHLDGGREPAAALGALIRAVAAARVRIAADEELAQAGRDGTRVYADIGGDGRDPAQPGASQCRLYDLSVLKMGDERAEHARRCLAAGDGPSGSRLHRV